MFSSLDRVVLAILAPLAAALLVSGLDDLVVDLAWAAVWLKSKLRPARRLFPPGPRQLEAAPRRKIAIFVPLWHEAGVIGRMLEHNLASIRYPDYHFFAGCYPNDSDTQEAVREVAARFPQVHLALSPHDGPTSKADCLNWVYQHLLLHEEQTGEIFDTVVMHDAEDLIHPEELIWINYYAARYDFVQTPVLALRTPLRKLTHGVYCDEFAEYHTRDMNVRAVLGGFIPGSGVGTGFRRQALERLARAHGNRLFEPEALTEDYENGLSMFRLKCAQAFVPLGRGAGGDFVATRELFPQTWSSALRQRTRWITGIALQGWERLGWSHKPGELYWLWRDRKGLIGNFVSLLANIVLIYGLSTGLWIRASAVSLRLAEATLALQLIRLGVRMACVARIYGFLFALGVPIRTVYANALNTAATFNAIRRYVTAKVRGQPLKWLKTEHAYPSRVALLSHKRKLGDILVGSGDITTAALSSALAECPSGMRLGEHLVNAGVISDATLYAALSFQQGLPVVHLDPREVPPSIAHALPQRAAKEWQVLPFRVAKGHLFLASPEVPSSKATEALASFTNLEIKFHLITPSEFAELTDALL